MKRVQLRYLPDMDKIITCPREVNPFFYYGSHANVAPGNVKSVVWNDLSEYVHTLYFV
jgi:hypothetical protein